MIQLVRNFASFGSKGSSREFGSVVMFQSINFEARETYPENNHHKRREQEPASAALRLRRSECSRRVSRRLRQRSALRIWNPPNDDQSREVVIYIEEADKVRFLSSANQRVLGLTTFRGEVPFRTIKLS
jgi:hypothetical protein